MGVDLTEQADAPEGDLEELDLIEGDEPEVDDPPEDDQDDPPEGEADEIEVKFGDEAAPASNEERESSVIRDIRARNRELAAENARLKAGEKPQVIEVGEKPTLEGCDYEADAFEAALEAWKDRKAQADKAEAETVSRVQAQQAAWAEELAEHTRKKIALKAPAYDAAEEEVVSTLNPMQQAIVIKAAEDSAKVIFALGRHPQKLATLAAIEDPIKFAVAVSNLERTITVSRRKPPEPDTPVRGSAPLNPASDKKLERLEAEADRTGDRTKVVQYKRSLKARA